MTQIASSVLSFKRAGRSSPPEPSVGSARGRRARADGIQEELTSREEAPLARETLSPADASGDHPSPARQGQQARRRDGMDERGTRGQEPGCAPRRGSYRTGIHPAARVLAARSAPVDQDHVQEIRDSLPEVGQIYPILVDQEGRILDGKHRYAANPEWKRHTVKVDSDEMALAIALWANKGAPLPPKVAGRIEDPRPWREDSEGDATGARQGRVA